VCDLSYMGCSCKYCLLISSLVLSCKILQFGQGPITLVSLTFDTQLHLPRSGYVPASQYSPSTSVLGTCNRHYDAHCTGCNPNQMADVFDLSAWLVSCHAVWSYMTPDCDVTSHWTEDWFL